MTAKGRHHINRTRQIYGKMFQKVRVLFLEKENKKAKVKCYKESSPEFEVYKPKRRKRK